MIDPADLRDVFDRAASLPPQDRAAFLARACGDNAVLRQEVERLLAADQRAGSVFDSGSGGIDGSAERDPVARDDRSALQPGARLGPYVILGPAGRGGMGEVYRARDTRLDRTVALKVLPSELVRDAAARRRFEREARAAAALSHPHICTLLDIGRQDETDFIVMEFVEGDTLAHRLARETPPLRESLRIGIEIGEALVAAHAAHIVHRDIKPGNAMLRPDGFVKVLDFGLAKLTLQIPSDGGDTTRALSTRAGLIVGTVAYMSPEQARGQDVDARTDVWSLGCVLYELAAGRPPFAGTSTTDVLAAVLQNDPIPLPVIDATTPAELQRIVAKALKKDRNERYQTAQDLVIDLKALRDDLAQHPTRSKSIHPGWTRTEFRRRSKWRWRSAAAIVVAAGAIAGGVWWRTREASPQLATGRLDRIAPLPLARLTFDSGLQMDPTFSPDGRFAAYASDRAGNFDIWVQPVAGGDAVQVTKSPAHETQPAWSPDGSTIVFRSERDGGGLFVVPALGGVQKRLTTFGHNPSWTADGREIRFLSDQPAALHTVSLAGDAPREMLPDFTASGGWRWIGVHPDGRVSFLGFQKQRGYGFFTVSEAGDVVDSHMMAHVPPELANMKHSGGQRFLWINGGQALIFETENNSGVQNLWKVSVDPSTLQWTSYERLTSGSGADVGATVSPDGQHLMFATTQMSDRLWQFRLDDRHRLVDGQPFTDEYGVIFGMDVSSDGQLAAIGGARLGQDPPEVNVWTMPIASRRPELLSTMALAPVWSADHRRLAYIRYQDDTSDPTRIAQPGAIAVRDMPGGPEKIVTPWSSDWWDPSDWMESDRAVIACHGPEIVRWPVEQSDPTRSPEVLFEASDKNDEVRQARLSPNGRWLCFLLKHGNTQQIGVTSADGTPKRPWTTVPAGRDWIDQVRWSQDGKTLYFLARTHHEMLNLWSAGFDPESGRPTGSPVALSQYDSPTMVVRGTGMTVLDHSAYLSVHTSSGNVWMLDKLGH